MNSLEEFYGHALNDISTNETRYAAAETYEPCNAILAMGLHHLSHDITVGEQMILILEIRK